MCFFPQKSRKTNEKKRNRKNNNKNPEKKRDFSVWHERIGKKAGQIARYTHRIIERWLLDKHTNNFTNAVRWVLFTLFECCFCPCIHMKWCGRSFLCWFFTSFCVSFFLSPRVFSSWNADVKNYSDLQPRRQIQRNDQWLSSLSLSKSQWGEKK